MLLPFLMLTALFEFIHFLDGFVKRHNSGISQLAAVWFLGERASGAEARLGVWRLWRHEWNSCPSRNLPQGLKPQLKKEKRHRSAGSAGATQKRTVRHAPTQA